MLSPRQKTILSSIVGQYITKAGPVPSQSVLVDCELGISAATIRNEVASLEEEGYITHPHPSAGSVPTDKGYRCYVESISSIELSVIEQRLISHLFHQVERELDEWLNLAATLIAQMAQNLAVVSLPKPTASRLKHLELVRLNDSLVLAILVLGSAKVRQQLITFDQPIPQPELTVLAHKLSAHYSGLTSPAIGAKGAGLAVTEQQVTDHIVKMMEAEDSREYTEPYLDGWYYMFNQPEFSRNRGMALGLMALVEQRNLLRSIVPRQLPSNRVQVVIGKENKTQAIYDYSVVIRRYGLPEEAAGTLAVIGPTRMPYARTMATIDYLTPILTRLVARLYGREQYTS